MKLTDNIISKLLTKVLECKTSNFDMDIKMPASALGLQDSGIYEEGIKINIKAENVVITIKKEEA